jgi:hypothetical protein
MHCTTGYYLKGGLVYLTMPTIGTTEDYGGMIFFPDGARARAVLPFPRAQEQAEIS